MTLPCTEKLRLSKTDKVTELHIQQLLYKNLLSAKLTRVFPNINLPHGEADLLCITTAGMVLEFEIKTGKSDFLREFSQKNIKHRLLSGKEKPTAGTLPNYFWLVAAFPANKVEDWPPYAGLMEVTRMSGSRGDYLCLTLHKEAPLLHRRKADARLTDKLLVNTLYKYWNLQAKYLFRE